MPVKKIQCRNRSVTWNKCLTFEKQLSSRLKTDTRLFENIIDTLVLHAQYLLNVWLTIFFPCR